MKKTIIRSLMGMIVVCAAALMFLPIRSSAAAKPSISLVTDYHNDNGLTYVIISNKGSMGEGVDAYNWTLTENATDLHDGTSTLSYSETRRGLSDRLYINTGKFKSKHSNAVKITATCPQLGYTYTVTLTIKDDELQGGGFHLVPAGTNCLYNGTYNKTIDGFTMPIGYLAKASVNAMLPAGYMDGIEGTLVFNYMFDNFNKSGTVCYNIPEGYITSNRTFKLATIGEGGVITVCDDIDLNPSTITANVNFNGYAVALCYCENSTASLPVSPWMTVPVTEMTPVLPVYSEPQTYYPLPNYNFERCAQGPACQNIFRAFTPAGFIMIDELSLKTFGSANNYHKNGIVTIAVDSKFLNYKLITVDSNGYTTVLEDLDPYPQTATFAVNFSGYACALVAR